MKQFLELLHLITLLHEPNFPGLLLRTLQMLNVQLTGFNSKLYLHGARFPTYPHVQNLSGIQQHNIRVIQIRLTKVQTLLFDSEVAVLVCASEEPGVKCPWRLELVARGFVMVFGFSVETCPEKVFRLFAFVDELVGVAGGELAFLLWRSEEYTS